MGWWSVATRSMTLNKRQNKIGVSRMSSILGASRTRSVLGGSILGGDDLDGNANEFLAATMGAISSMLECNLGGATGSVISTVLQAARSCRC